MKNIFSFIKKNKIIASGCYLASASERWNTFECNTFELTKDGTLTISRNWKQMHGLDKKERFPFCQNINIKKVIVKYGVVSIGDDVFRGCISLVSVKISDTVVSIKKSAFEGCTSLKTIKIPNSVTSIGDNAFRGCTSLESIKIPNRVTSIDDSVFRGCTSLKTIKIPNSVTSIENFAFSGCTSLESIEIPNSVRFIRNNAFRGCTSLKTIKIPNSVTSIENSVFEGCTSLKTIKIPSSVTSIEKSAFEGCTSLETIEIPDSVTFIGDNVFSGCISLLSKIVKLRQFSGHLKYKLIDDGTLFIFGEGDMDDYYYLSGSPFFENENITKIIVKSGVTSIGDYAFRGCTSLESIEIPDSVTSIGDYAFSGCTSLKTIKIPDSVTSIEKNAFARCTSLSFFNVGIQNEKYLSENGVLYSKDKSILIKYPIGKKETVFNIPNSVTSIENFAFSDCISLELIEIPNSVTSIENFAFSDCISLELIEIPDSVTSIEKSAFSGCTSLKTIKIPNSVTSISEGVFSGCTSLELIEISDNVTSIEKNAFDGCTSLSFFNVGIQNEKYLSENGVLYSKDKSILIKYPIGKKETVFNIPNSVTSIENFAFGGTSLESIEIPDSVTFIGLGAFFGCRSLESIEIMNNLITIWVNAFKDTAFYNNKPDGLIYINDILYGYKGKMPEKTHIKVKDGIIKICDFAFYNCTSLESIEIPNSVTSIGNRAFSGCTSLESIEIPSSVEFIGCGAFEETKWYNSWRAPVLINDKILYKYKYNRFNYTTNIKLGDGITQICDDAFEYCTELKSITIPNTVTSIGYNAFRECVSLESMICLCKKPPRIFDAGEIKNDIIISTKCVIKVPLGTKDVYVKDWAINECNVEEFSYGYELKENGTLFIFGEGDMDDYNLIRSPFFANKNITKIIVKSGVTSIGGGAFDCCRSLESIEIPDSVTFIGGSAFSGCTSLKSIEIPDNVTSIEKNAFDGCTLLKTIKIPDSVTSIGDYAFRGCTSLESIEIPDNVTSIEKNAFDGCTSLKIIKIPNSVTSIGDNAFYGCTSLESIEIPNSVEFIAYNAFRECSSLISIICFRKQPPKILNNKSIAIPHKCIVKVLKREKSVYKNEWGVDEQCIEGVYLTRGECGKNIFYELKNDGTLIIWGNGVIEDRAFENDNRIKKIITEKGVTFIGVNAFRNCKRLRFVEIASSIEEIENGVFLGCENVVSIIVKSDSPPIVGFNTFEGLESSVEIVVPELAMRYYKAAKGWNKFTNYVVED